MIPSDIAGLKLWLKADAITGLADADPVTTWPDSSGLGHDVGQATAAKKPTYQTNEINGKPVVRFDAVDDFLGNATLVVAQPLTIVVVERAAVANHLGNFIDGSVRCILGHSSLVYRLYAGGAGSIEGGTTDTSAHSMSGHFNGASSEMWKDGTSIATGDPGTLAYPAGYKIGSDHNGADQFFNGDIAEVIIYDSALSAADRNALGGYIQTKYGITITGATFPPPAGGGVTTVNSINKINSILG